MRKHIAILATLMMVSLSATVATSASNAAEHLAEPDAVVIAAHRVGTGGHRLVALAAEGLIEHTGKTIRLVPAASDTGRALQAREGVANAMIQNSIAVWALQEGLYDFATRDWGPQKVTYLWIPEHAGVTMAVRGDSGVTKIEDLRGKDVQVFPGSPAMQIMQEALLAYGGLTLDDVNPVPVSSPVAAADEAIKGRMPTSIVNVVAGKAHELAEISAGMEYLQMDPADEEAWVRVKGVAPMMWPKQATIGAQISEDSPVWVFGQGYPSFISWRNLDENKAYYITKWLHESHGTYKTKHPSLDAAWTLETVLSNFENEIAPMHPGSVEYFKEIGVWSEARERMNQERLQRQEKLADLWEGFIAEAGDLDEEAFADAWLQARRQAGFWVPPNI